MQSLHAHMPTVQFGHSVTPQTWVNLLFKFTKTFTTDYTKKCISSPTWFLFAKAGVVLWDVRQNTEFIRNSHDHHVFWIQKSGDAEWRSNIECLTYKNKYVHSTRSNRPRFAKRPLITTTKSTTCRCFFMFSFQYFMNGHLNLNRLAQRHINYLSKLKNK